MSADGHGVLRRIAVHVEETRSGFEWVLSEADDDEDDENEGPWRSLKRARKAVETYQASMADGLLALQSLIDDLDTGPRRSADVEPESKPVRAGRQPARKASKAEGETSRAKARTGSAFGFGLMK
ncbi:hypothetical protein [Variovorax paradoxus]|uniref:hypothetical protein n=1 Tax=Variovorax paradoxus TaxID=34073 RepID=UPI000699AAC3|nr:hypothetical protein [Variovorax paradoxus]